MSFLGKLKKIVNEKIFFNMNFYKKNIYNYKPIFIIGCPRSGTTLVYQSIINYLNLGYISNFHCHFYGNLPLFEKFLKISKNRNINFNSNYGVTNSLYGPSECGNFWYLFFNKNFEKESDLNLNSKKRLKLKKILNSFMYLINNNLVIKNVYNNYRLNELNKIFPNAVYIYVKRDILYNSQSLLEARKKRYGSYDVWFSLPVFNKNIYNLENYKQVVNQCLYINEYIDKQIVNLNHFIIDYDSFCDDPKKILNELHIFLEKKYIKVNINKDNLLPKKFKKSKKIKINKVLFKKLENYVSKK